jgi:hypothetical protein
MEPKSMAGKKHGLLYFFRLYVNTRETREVWPLLTVETEVNEESKSTNERGPFLVGELLGLVVQVQDIFFCLGCSIVVPVQNNSSSPYTISIPMSPSPCQPDRQPSWLALSSCVSLVITLVYKANFCQLQNNFAIFSLS